MGKIVLISCVKKKLNTPAKAKDLYISTLFKMNLAYAATLRPDSIFILSAKHGLVELAHILEPYELTLNTMKKDEIQKWAAKVLAQLEGKCDVKKDTVIFLAGNNYRKFLLPSCKHAIVPMKGLGLGRQLQFLKRRISHEK
jgi:cytoplasmic iron level regulating protein YaaA (DUF328/UPF0246 family)